MCSKSIRFPSTHLNALTIHLWRNEHRLRKITTISTLSAIKNNNAMSTLWRKKVRERFFFLLHLQPKFKIFSHPPCNWKLKRKNLINFWCEVKVGVKWKCDDDDSNDSDSNDDDDDENCFGQFAPLVLIEEDKNCFSEEKKFSIETKREKKFLKKFGRKCEDFNLVQFCCRNERNKKMRSV